MSNLARNIRNLLEARNLTQAQLSAVSGVDSATISRVMTGKAPLVSNSLPALASALRVTTADLLSEGPPVVPTESGINRIPVLDYIQAAHFSGATPHPLENGREGILTDGDYRNMAFALRIKGNSMNPDFNQGDMVVIDTKEKERPGDFVVAREEGMPEVTFRQYRAGGVNEKGEEIFELHPLNPIYAPLRSDRHKITIIGVMMEYRRFTLR